MQFAGMNYLAIAAAAVASFLFGALWYGALSKQWLAALGKSADEIKGAPKKPPVIPMAISIICEFVMAWVFAGVLGHLGPGQVTVRNGLVTALFLWSGFIVTTMATGHAYQMQKRSLTVIDGGHWLGVMLIQGLIIGAFGVR